MLVLPTLVFARKPIRGTLAGCAEAKEPIARTNAANTTWVPILWQTILDSIMSPLSNHLIRSRQHVRWNCYTDLLGGFEVDHQFELRRLLDGNVGWLGSLQYFFHENRGALIQFRAVGSVGHQSSVGDKFCSIV